MGIRLKLYKLDKATGRVIGYQGSIGHWAGGPAHGMDWSHEEQEMYLTTEVYLGTENTLRIIDLSNANTTVVGDLGIGNWIGTIAVAPILPADAGIITGSDTSAIFESAGDWTGTYTIKVMASNDCGTSPWSSELSCMLAFTPQPYFVAGGGDYCDGSPGLEVILDGSETDVDYELFFDNVSTGTILTGTGSPLSFGYQTDEGIYSVTGYSVDCSTPMFGEAYIYLVYLPVAGSQPTGPNEVCSSTITDYQTVSIPEADTLMWILSPSEAGVIIGSGENISIEWSLTYSGYAYLSVYGSNDCGDGDPSDELEINISQLPQPEVVGEVVACKNDVKSYYTDDNTGSTYNWEVQGGDIVSGSGTSEIDIFNQFGQQVYTGQTVTDGGQGSHQINIGSLPTGLYFVKMTTSLNQAHQSRFEVVR